MFYLNYANSGNYFRTSWQTKDSIKPASAWCVWGCKNSRRRTTKLGKLELSNQAMPTGRMSKVSCTTQASRTFQKSSERSLSAGITTTYQQVIFRLRKLENLLPGNTTGQRFAMTLRTTWGDATYAWLQKQSATSPMGTYNLCRCLPTVRRIYKRILSLVYQFWQIGRETVTTQSLSLLIGSQKWFIISQSRLPSTLRALLR